MQKRVWKFVPTDESASIKMPEGGYILSAGNQNGRMCIWALVDPERPLVDRQFKVVGTGQPFDPEHWTFIDTVQFMNGAIVLHVFASSR